MKRSIKNLTAFLFAILFGASQAQRIKEGPFVGLPESRKVTRVAEWYCPVTRIVGCVKYNHICFIEFIFGDDRCDPVTAQSTRCPTQTDADRCDSHEDISTITHFQGFVGEGDSAIAGLKFYADDAEYLLGSDEDAFESGLQTVEGGIVGLKYERSDEFDYVGLLVATIRDPEVREELAESQAAKAELMAQYNQALANAAEAEDRGDDETAGQFDAEAKSIYQQLITANQLEGEIIENAEAELLGLPIWLFVVIIAGAAIVLILIAVATIKCCRKANQKDANTMKVTPQAVSQSVDTEKDLSDHKSAKVAQQDYYSQNQATDVNVESGDNKPVVSDKVINNDKVELGL